MGLRLRHVLASAGAALLPSTAHATVDVASSGGTVKWVLYVDGGSSGSNATARIGSQSFVTPYDLVSINACIWLANRAPSAGDSVTVSVRTHVAGLPGVVLASQSFTTATSSSTRFCFPFDVSLTAGETYHITVAGNLQPLQEGYHLGFEKNDLYPSGQFYNSADDGVTWTVNAGQDAIFDITGELAPGTYPTAISPFDYMASPHRQPLFGWNVPTAGPGPNHFRVEWATDPTFTTGLVTRASNTAPAGFSTTAPCTGPPYAVGCGTVYYKVQAADILTNGTTYWWRVSASSDGGSTWRPGTKRSFTIDTSLVSRAWRLTTTAQFDGGTLTNVTSASDEVKLITTGANYALQSGGSTVTATTQQASFPPENAVDDDTATLWASTQSPQNAPQELVVDLGQSRVIERINFSSLTGGAGANRPSDFTFETSSDGTTWTVRDTVVGNTVNFYEKVLSPTIGARYVKLRCTRATGGGAPNVFVHEFRIIGVPPSTGSLVTAPVALADFGAWPDTFSVVSVPNSAATLKITAQRFSGGTWVDTTVVDGPFTGPLTSATRILATSTLGAEPQLRFRIDYTAGSTGTLHAITAGGNVSPLSADDVELSARLEDGRVVVTWTAWDESEISGYRLLRTGEGDWDLLAEHGAGESTYSFVDEAPPPDAAYRLEVVHHGGEVSSLGPVSPEPSAQRAPRCSATASGRGGAGACLTLATLAALLGRRVSRESRYFFRDDSGNRTR